MQEFLHLLNLLNKVSSPCLINWEENSLAAAKVTREFLTNEGVSEDKINSSINSTVDEMFGKPYQKTLMDNCYAFIFKLIPNGKEKVEETSKTIYGG